MGVEARFHPSKSTAHCRHMKRQPFLCNDRPHVVVAIAIAIAISVTIANSVAVAVTVTVTIAHRCRRCRQPLPLQLTSTITAAISVTWPSAIAVAIALAVGHCRLHHHRPSQLPLPLAITVAMLLAISESCCLGKAKIVFNQLKQRMLTLFYFVQTVGGALIKAGRLTRCQTAMANTSVGGRQVASIKPIVREVAGSRGAAGGQQGGDID